MGSEMCIRDRLIDPYEVIVLDSGSQDRTLDIVRRFPVQVESVLPEKFTFGYALNYGATVARGEYVIFLSAHCAPCHHQWLRDLTAPLESDPSIAATYGQQKPRHGVNLFEERELQEAYTLRKDNTVRASFSNANSALRRHVVLGHPFDETIPIGEDFLWAYTLPASYQVRYVHTAAVLHSHPLRLRYWRQRWYNEGLMVQYLAQVHSAPDPWANKTPQVKSIMKRNAFKRIELDMQALWQKRALRAMCRYPFYLFNRIYFYKKGQRDGQRLYSLPNPARPNLTSIKSEII